MFWPLILMSCGYEENKPTPNGFAYQYTQYVDFTPGVNDAHLSNGTEPCSFHVTRAEIESADLYEVKADGIVLPLYSESRDGRYYIAKDSVISKRIDILHSGYARASIICEQR